MKDDIKEAMKKSEITIAVLTDYSKAFDTVHHKILLSKLQSLNFSISTIKPIESYLSNRKQFVQIDDQKS